MTHLSLLFVQPLSFRLSGRQNQSLQSALSKTYPKMCERGEEKAYRAGASKDPGLKLAVSAFGQVTNKHLLGVLKHLPKSFSVVCLVAPL